jgi:8-oxo-dGTP pyrophosphatase MutT (NUDIX family)
MIPQILFEQKPFLQNIIDRLGANSIDFEEKWKEIKNSISKSSTTFHAAAVLFLLQFTAAYGEFTIQLIKRSETVSQPGDLSFPGGAMHPLTDRLLQSAMDCLLPLMSGGAGRYSRQRGSEVDHLVRLFLATALRESWEEIGLNPCYVHFLGPLPTYSLTLFQRTIFPLVGFVRSSWRGRPNYEVEKILEVPVRIFFCCENFRRFILDVNTQTVELPAIAVRNREDQEEILWGATFNIIIRFLQITLDYTLPDLSSSPMVRRHLSEDYLTGRRP